MSSSRHPFSIAAGIVVAVLFIGLVAFFVNAYFETPHPLGQRVCECDLLKEWVSDLPILPGGHSFEEGFTALEDEEGFTISTGGSSPVPLDRVHKDRILTAFTDQGLQIETRSDTTEEWHVVFFPGSTSDRLTRETPWRFDVYSSTGMGLRVNVNADGSQYGINTVDELWQLYDDDRKTALEIQRERQKEAMALLEPVRQAVLSLTHDT